jgi:hypothetical protein
MKHVFRFFEPFRPILALKLAISDKKRYCPAKKEGVREGYRSNRYDFPSHTIADVF